MEDQISFILANYPIYEEYVKTEKVALQLQVKAYTSDMFKPMLTGSFAEGFPDSIDSDTDFMLFLTEPFTTKWQEKLFVVLPNAPAHLKIILPECLLKEFKDEFPVMTGTMPLVCQAGDGENVLFISATALRQLNVNDFLPEGWQQEKPSAPYERKSDNLTSPSYCLQSLVCERTTTDRVAAIECENWPITAAEWVNRHRRNWPSESVVTEISKGGFAVVPKPSSATGDIDKEWRFSFSKAEAVLLQGLAGNQRKVYYVLRSIYVRYIKQRGETILSSYCIKTALFWMLQDKDQSFWNQTNISSIILSVFQLMYDYLKDQYFPHFFLPSHNILYAASKNDYLKAQKIVKEVLEDLLIVLLKISTGGYVGLLPIFGLLAVRRATRHTKEILKMSEAKALVLFKPTKPDDIAFSKKLSNQCLVVVLEETIDAIKQFPNTTSFLEVYLPLVYQGYHLARAINVTRGAVQFDALAAGRTDPNFTSIYAEEMNQFFLLWLEIFKLGVKLNTEGKAVQLFSFAFNIKELLTLEPNDALTESATQKLEIFHKMCAIPASFMAAEHMNPSRVCIKQVYEKLDQALTSLRREGLPEHGFSEQMVFFLSAGSFQIARKGVKKDE